jgi:(R)-2-hydroxyacyl-CoA dehydratese activating ATPase
MQRVAGIDVGSGFTKAVIIEPPRSGDAAPKVVGYGRVATGTDLDKAATLAYEAALADAKVKKSDIGYVATTGFGRSTVSFRDIQITEITSGARGAHYLFPESNAVLDIGSQSTRAVTMDANGKVSQFKTNDKCAAGSGSFIVRAVKYLQIPLETVGDLALGSTNPQAISSICAVLAESEIINHVSAGVGLEDIVGGIYASLADRAAMLLKRAGSRLEVVLIGGVAIQKGMVKAMEAKLKTKVRVPEHPEYVCALGAALLGMKRYEKVTAERSATTGFAAGQSAATSVQGSV